MTGNLRKVLILSIWEDVWSLGEGAGVADELEFIQYMTQRGIELHFLVPKSRLKRATSSNPLLTYHTYPNIFELFKPLPMLRSSRTSPPRASPTLKSFQSDRSAFATRSAIRTSCCGM